MTALLENAFAKTSTLPPECFTDELQSEERWPALFAKSQDALESMRWEAINDFRAGRTTAIG